MDAKLRKLLAPSLRSLAEGDFIIMLEPIESWFKIGDVFEVKFDASLNDFERPYIETAHGRYHLWRRTTRDTTDNLYGIGKLAPRSEIIPKRLWKGPDADIVIVEMDNPSSRELSRIYSATYSENTRMVHSALFRPGDRGIIKGKLIDLNMRAAEPHFCIEHNDVLIYAKPQQPVDSYRLLLFNHIEENMLFDIIVTDDYKLEVVSVQLD